MANFQYTAGNASSSSAKQDNVSYDFDIHCQAALDAGFPLNAEKGQERVLYVGNLGNAVTEKLIIGMLEEDSCIVQVKVISNTSSPFAFVEFEDHDAALRAMDNHKLLNSGIKLEWISISQNVVTTRKFDVFVGNLSPDVDSNALRKAFMPFGDVFGVKIIYDKKTHNSKGYGFVSYSTCAEAQRAIDQMRGKFLGMKPIDTDWGTQKSNNAPDLQSVQSNQSTDYISALENKYTEQIKVLIQELATKNREIANLKNELQKQNDVSTGIQQKHDDLKKMYDQVYADATRFYQEHAKLENDLKEQTLSLENFERHLNSRIAENHKLQLENYELKLKLAQSSNSTDSGDASTQNQLHSSNGGQASNATSTSQQCQKRPFPMPKLVKKEVIEEIDRKAETYSNQRLIKPLKNENQSSVMNQAKVVNASSNVNGQEENKLVTDLKPIFSGFSSSLVSCANDSVPSIAANSSKRKSDATSKDNARSSKRSKL